jgi:hypothetical protein
MQNGTSGHLQNIDVIQLSQLLILITFFCNQIVYMTGKPIVLEKYDVNKCGSRPAAAPLTTLFAKCLKVPFCMTSLLF